MSRNHSINLSNSYNYNSKSKNSALPMKNTVSLSEFSRYLDGKNSNPAVKNKSTDISVKLLQFSIFELYGIGLNYSLNTGYGLPYGVGIMLTESLILTTNRNLPTAEHALISIIKFISCPEITFRLNPNVFFYTNYSKNLTIAAITIHTQRSSIKILETRHKFKLFKGETIKILNTTFPCIINNISSNNFIFQCPENLLPGTPIFSNTYKLQGIYTLTTTSLSIKEASRVDKLLDSLLHIKNILLHPELELFLTEYTKIFNIPILQSGRLGDCKDLY